jgi:ABA4-like protein
METVFLAFNYGILVPWALLVLAPRWIWTRRIVHASIVPIALALAYLFLLSTDRPGPQGAHFFSLDGVTRIFTSPQTIVAAWLHYLIGDLFLGAWEARDAERLGIPHLAVVPSMILTLMFGPAGLASWLVLRAILRKRVTLVEVG